MKINKNRKINPKFLLLILSILCIALLFVSYFNASKLRPIKQFMGNLVVPMQHGANTVGEWFSDKAKIFSDNEKLREENAALQKQVDYYESQMAKYELELSELKELRGMFALDELFPDYHKVGARVFSTNSVSWFSEFYIDKGLNQGIYQECNVLCDEGLLGIVVESYDNYAKVRAIIDDRQVVACEIVPSGTLCKLEGSLDTIDDGYLKIVNIEKDAAISVGDRVITSNYSDRYFYGITVGYITEITMDSNNLTKTAKLAPCVDFSEVHDVLVITDRKQEVHY